MQISSLRRSLFLACLCLSLEILSGCEFLSQSSTRADLPQSPPLVLEGFELYLSRASLKGADFEHYRVSQNAAYCECGALTRGRAIPSEQKIFNPTAAYNNALQSSGSALSSYILEKNPKFDPPGDTRSPFNPGEVRLTIDLKDKHIEVLTTLDSLAPPSSKATSLLREFVEYARGACSVWQ